MNWILATLAAVLIKIVLDELLDWSPWLAQRLVQRAARQLPEHSQERYAEEWLAELDALPGKCVSKLLFAIRVRWYAVAVHDAIDETFSQRTSLPVRLLNIFASAAALVFFAPMIAALAVVVRLSTRGPVTVRLFHVDASGTIVSSRLVFRTFGVPSSAVEIGTVVKPTPVGRWLLRTELDQLPALIDAVRGRVTLADLVRRDKRD